MEEAAMRGKYEGFAVEYARGSKIVAKEVDGMDMHNVVGLKMQESRSRNRVPS